VESVVTNGLKVRTRTASIQVKSSRGATHSHSELSDPNVFPPPGSWAMTVIPGVRPWEELVEVAMLP